MSAAVHITWHGAQINFGDLPPYLIYAFRAAESTVEKRLKGWLTGSGNLLHPALHRHLQEGGPPHRIIRRPATGGQSHPASHFVPVFQVPNTSSALYKRSRRTFVKCKTGSLKICSTGSLTMASRNNSSRGKSWVLPAVPSSKLQTLESNANSGSC